MARFRQPDLFIEPQADLFAAEKPRAYVPPVPDPAHIRAKLHVLLAQARAADTWPWKASDVRLYQTIFPQMANWLPEEEANQLRLAFAAEVARLNAA